MEAMQLAARNLRAGTINRDQVTKDMQGQIEECQAYLKRELADDDAANQVGEASDGAADNTDDIEKSAFE